MTTLETSIDYTDHDKAVLSTDEQKWHRRIRAYKEQYPDQVRIKYEPETNDGNMVAEIPVKWVKIKPPKRMNYSDEQLAAMAKKSEIARPNPTIRPFRNQTKRRMTMSEPNETLLDDLDRISLYFIGCFNNAQRDTKAAELFHRYIVAVDTAKKLIMRMAREEDDGK